MSDITGSASGSTLVMTGGSSVRRHVPDRAGHLLAHVVGGVVDVALEDEPDRDLRVPSAMRAEISSIPETPLIASSIGSTTDVDISSGLAPGSDSATLTVAGSAFGNRSTPRSAERERSEHHERHHEHRRRTPDGGRRVQTASEPPITW